MKNTSTYSPLMRITATVVLVTFTMLILEPTASAAQVLYDEYQNNAVESASVSAAKLSQTVLQIETTLTKWQQRSKKRSKTQPNFSSLRKALRGLKQQILDHYPYQ